MAKMPAQTGAGFVEDAVALAKAEPHEMIGLAVQVKGRDRDGGNAGFCGDVTAEIGGGPGEADGANVDGEKVTAFAGKDLKADVSQPGGEAVSLCLLPGCKIAKVGRVLAEPVCGCSLQVRRRREGHELVSFGNRRQKRR